MTRSARPVVVRRNTSLTIRQRFTPDNVCATTTRTLENSVLRNFSPTLNSLPGGFFLVVWSTWLLARSLESRCLYRVWRWSGKPLVPHPLPSCHAFSLGQSDSNRPLSSCWRCPRGCSYPYGLSFCRYSAPFAGCHLSDAGGGVLCRPPGDGGRRRVPKDSPRPDARRALGLLPSRARRVARSVGGDESRSELAVDSARIASRASFAADGSCGRPR